MKLLLLHLTLILPALNFLHAKASQLPSEPFDSHEATIDGIHNALFSGISSCRDIMSSFISRIEAFNPPINAIISLNPNALTIANDEDARSLLEMLLGRCSAYLSC